MRTVDPMLAHLLDDIARVEAALDHVEGDAVDLDTVRHALRQLSRGVARYCYVDGDVEVGPDHRSTAFAFVTAYLDGAVRDDGFALLATTIADRINRDGTDPTFVVAVVAALARLCGDLAGAVVAMPADPVDDEQRRRALAVVQRLAADC